MIKNLLGVKESVQDEAIKKINFFGKTIFFFTDKRRYVVCQKGIRCISHVTVLNIWDFVHKLQQYGLSIIKPLVIVVTGTVGKSSTTSFIYQSLDQIYPEQVLHVLGDPHNIANALLNLKVDTKFVVLECGIEQKKSWSRRYNFRIDIGCITNISPAHFKTHMADKENYSLAEAMDTVLEAKYEITANLNGPLFIAPDIPVLKSAIIAHNTIEASHLPSYYKNNLAIVRSVLEYLNVDMNQIDFSILTIPASHGNTVFLKNLGITFYDHSHNPVYQGQIAALSILKDAPGRKVAILSDIPHLGESNVEYTKKVLNYAQEIGVDIILPIKKISAHLLDRPIATFEEIKNTIKRGDYVLLKGGTVALPLAGLIYNWEKSLEN